MKLADIYTSVLAEYNDPQIYLDASKVLNVDQAKEWLNVNCPDYKTIPRLYKGMKDSVPRISVLDASKIKRTSQNTYNYYTEFLDKSPYWKDYPKRSSSVICTNSINTAYAYGDIYIVIPKQNALVGICPERDMWLSFYGLQDLGYELLMYFNNELASEGVAVSYEGVIDYFKKRNIDIDKVMSPNENKFELARYSNIESKLDEENETWVSGECLIIRKDVYFQQHFVEEDEW